MPVCNSENTVGIAVQSILSQTYKDFEFIIIDDASVDTTAKVVRKMHDKRIFLTRNSRCLGVAGSLNKALTYTKGKYIARMDADDIALPNRLQTQLSFMKKNPAVDAVGSWVEIIDCYGKSIGYKKNRTQHSEIKKYLLAENQLIHPTLFVRKKLLERIGGYRENREGAEDYELIALLMAAGARFANIPKFLLKYRRCKSSISYQTMKKVEFQALRVRANLLLTGTVPWTQVYLLIKPVISFCVPTIFKSIWFKYE